MMLDAPSAPKTVWIVNHYAALAEKDGWTGLHASLSPYLPRSGWRPLLIASSTAHPSGEQKLARPEPRERVRSGADTLLIRCPAYSGSGVRRVANMIIFTTKVIWDPQLLRRPRPDVIVGRSVHPLAAWAGLRLARRMRVPFVFEVADLWPETLIALGAISRGSLVSRGLRLLEGRLIRSASVVLSPLPGVSSYLEEEGHDPSLFRWVSNGIDATQPLPPLDRESNETFTFMYLGGLGKANEVELIIRAFDVLATEESSEKLRLRIVGSGPERARLEAIAASLRSAELIGFEDRVPRSLVLDIAAESDCLVAAMKPLPLYRYGIALNKMFDYLLAGRPIVFASAAINDPVQDAQAGITVRPGDEQSLADGLRQVLRSSHDQRIRWGSNGRRYVLSEFSYEALSAKYAAALDDAMRRSEERAST